MSPLEAVLRRALANLTRAGARGAVIGGQAVSARTEQPDLDALLARFRPNG